MVFSVPVAMSEELSMIERLRQLSRKLEEDNQATLVEEAARAAHVAAATAVTTAVPVMTMTAATTTTLAPTVRDTTVSPVMMTAVSQLGADLTRPGRAGAGTATAVVSTTATSQVRRVHTTRAPITRRAM